MALTQWQFVRDEAIVYRCRKVADNWQRVARRTTGHKLRTLHQQLHRFVQPAGVPAVFALGAVAVFVGDLEFGEEVVDGFVVGAEIGVAEEQQARLEL